MNEWSYMRNLSILFLLTNTLLLTGCTRLMVPRAPAGGRMAVYQAAGAGPLPVSSLKPLAGQPRQITSRKDVQAIADALNHPDREGVSRMGRNNRLAVVSQNGTVVMFGITGPDPVCPCDVSTSQGSRRLSTALLSALAEAQHVTLAPASPISSLSYQGANGSDQIAGVSLAKRAGLLREIFGCYSPLALKGNRRCGTREVQDYASRVPDHLTIKLVQPESMETIIETRLIQWPPEVCDRSARLTRVRYDTITVFHESGGQVRFAFSDSVRGRCLFTDPVGSRRCVKPASGRTPPVYGPDLFDEMVKDIRRA